MSIRTVYIGGALTPRGINSKNLAIDHLINQRKMIRAALDVFLAGFDPFCPAFDHLFWMVMNDDEFITEASIKRYSKTWLSKCDALLLTPGWQRSPGTVTEMGFAEQLGIPVFTSLKELKKWEKLNE